MLWHTDANSASVCFLVYAAYTFVAEWEVCSDMDYCFEVIEINPTYLTESEARNRLEQLITELLDILDEV